MSYEKIGMGWSEPSLTNKAFLQASGNTCYGENTRAVCFLNSETGIAEANACRERNWWWGGPVGCKTDRDQSGRLYCCRPGYPREYYQTSTISTPNAPGLEVPALPSIPEVETDPAAVHPASFFEKLLHPGALLAIGTFSLAGVLFYHNWRAR